MNYDFSLRNQVDYKIAQIGAEAEPLIMIDGLMNDAESVIQCAESDSVYGPAGAAYPGIRAPVPKSYSQNLMAGLGPLLHEVFEIPQSIRYSFESTFALVTDPSRTLHHIQRVPHTDRPGPYNLAMVHFLCDSSFGGTSFFRHKSSGWQRISTERYEEYDRILNRELARNVMPAEFPGAAHPLFDLITTIESGFDRLIIYRASMLHSPGINPEAAFTADPRLGRLTITSFLDPID